MLKIFTFLLLLILPQLAFAEDIELTADNGLEWNQKEQKIIMRENATAKRHSRKSFPILPFLRSLPKSFPLAAFVR